MVRIVTDSAADIPREEGQELGITVVPLYVRFGTQVYRDGIELSAEEFYQKLVTSGIFPVTSAPSPGEMAEGYDRLAEETDEIVAIHVSSRLSSVCEVASQGRAQMDRKCRVELIDSLSGAMGEGLTAIVAAREAPRGGDMGQVVETER